MLSTFKNINTITVIVSSKNGDGLEQNVSPRVQISSHINEI